MLHAMRCDPRKGTTRFSEWETRSWNLGKKVGGYNPATYRVLSSPKGRLWPPRPWSARAGRYCGGLFLGGAPVGPMNIAAPLVPYNTTLLR